MCHLLLWPDHVTLLSMGKQSNRVTFPSQGIFSHFLFDVFLDIFQPSHILFIFESDVHLVQLPLFLCSRTCAVERKKSPPQRLNAAARF